MSNDPFNQYPWWWYLIVPLFIILGIASPFVIYWLLKLLDK